MIFKLDKPATNRIKSFSLKKFTFSETTVTIFFLSLIAGLTYLPMIGQLGFYRDDWHVIWAGTTRGWQAIIDLHLIDRPFMGLVYGLTYLLLGNNPLAWQLYIFVLRSGSALAFLWLLRLLFPGQRLATALSAMLFLVYPGFLQMPTASAYQCHFSGFLSGILSLIFTVMTVQCESLRKRILFTTLSVLFALGCFLMMEYMVGLEGVRLLLLYLLCDREKATSKPNIPQTLRKWLPNLVALMSFLFWRIFIFKSARSVTDIGSLSREYISQPGFMILRLITETLKSFVDTIFLAWGVPFYNTITTARYTDLLLSLCLALIGALGLHVYLHWCHKSTQASEEKSLPSTKALLYLGGLGTLSAILPVVLSNRQVQFENTFDRYTLPATIGAAIFWMGLIFQTLKPKARNILLSGLLVTAIMTHINNAAHFRDLWTYQKQLWWQLVWRAPALKQNTALLAMLPPGYRLGESYEIWAPANLIFYPRKTSPQVAGEILNQKTLFEMKRQENLGRSVRRIEYILDYKNSLLLSIPQPGSCLHVVDGQWLELSSGEDALVRLVAPLSQISMIEIDQPQKTPPEIIFGQEPKHGWCYYYQKASLARQREDWQEAARLADEVLRAKLQPQDTSEWMPFFVAYARTQRFDDANILASWLREDQNFRHAYCEQFAWMRHSEKRIEYIISNLCPELLE